MPTQTEKPYKHVDRLTEKHIDVFVENIRDRSGTLADAIARTRIMQLPDECECLAGQRFHPDAMRNDENEILRRTLKRIESSLREAFRQSAEEVLGIGGKPTNVLRPVDSEGKNIW